MKKQTVEARRNEILETTCQVVIERGFAATRISDVAKRLDVSSSLIHYHFDSKEQLLAEAFAHYARNDVADMQAAIDSADTSVAKLERVLQSYVPEGSDDLEWMLWIDGWGEALRNPMMKAISQQLDAQTDALLVQVIADGVAAGEFSCSSPHDTAARLTALVDGLAIQLAAHEGAMSREQLITHVRTVAAAEVGISLADLEAAAGEVPSSASRPSSSPAAEVALRSLVDRYCDAVAQRDADAWIATWTDDATWDRDAGTVVTGRDAILAEWSAAMKGFRWVVQLPGACVFTVDDPGGTATGRVIITERWKRTKGGAGGRLGVYHDTYRRIDGRWRFAARRLETIELS